MTDSKVWIIGVFFSHGSCDNIGTPSFSQLSNDILANRVVFEWRSPPAGFSSISIFPVGIVGEIVIVFFLLDTETILGFWEYGGIPPNLSGDGSRISPENYSNLFLRLPILKQKIDFVSFFR